MEKPVLAIVSRQLLWRHALACLISSHLQYDLLGEFGYRREISGDKHGQTCLFILDAELPYSDIKELIHFCRDNQNKVIILGSGHNRKRLVDLMSLKADGYLTTDISEDEFLLLLHKVINGAPVIVDSLIPELVNKLSDISDCETETCLKENTLTPREKEILKLLVAGFTNSQIAKKLVISVYTVKNHVHNILDKLEIGNRVKLVTYALSQGIVS